MRAVCLLLLGAAVGLVLSAGVNAQGAEGKNWKGKDLEKSDLRRENLEGATEADPVAIADPPAKADPAPQPNPKKEPAEGEGPKGAPPAKEVKGQLEKKMWGPPAQGGTRHTYDYKAFKFGEPRTGNFKTDGVPANRETVIYPVRVAVEITRTFTDGTSKKDEKKQTYVFFKDEFGDWTFRFKSND
ncbi:hypothetical protein [Gemmata sp.]|uniref:hypothetical protein n=1 Tax=Gemmata sp. TaxID=1914242 RepID=UPI003F6F0E25